jgi:hypothetical protein
MHELGVISPGYSRHMHIVFLLVNQRYQLPHFVYSKGKNNLVRSERGSAAFCSLFYDPKALLGF